MKTLAYINPDCYVDVDMGVLKYIARHFRVVWFPVYYTDRKIYYTPEQIREYAERYGIEIHPCPRLYRQRDPRNLSFYSKIVETINGSGADLVYSCITEELYWTIASRKLKAKRVLGLHDVLMHNFSNPLKRFIQTEIRKQTIKDSPSICVFSENQRLLLKKVYGREAAILGLSSRDLGHSDKIRPALSEGIRILFFGSILQYKGLDLLIEALEALKDEGVSNIILTVAGKGNYWDVCQKLIRTQEIYDLRVRFIDNEEIPDLLALHHFMILPYRDATQSGPLMIAAGYGLPVIAPDYGCFRECYSNDSGILYSDLKSALRRASAMTEAEYEAMSRNAGELADCFSEEVVSKRYIDYFNKL